jgi:urease accessory protein
MRFQRSLLVLILTGITSTAQAHTGFHAAEGWGSGFAHPLLGLDHFTAMLSVGLWAVFITPPPRQIWLMPLAFIAVMILGGVLGAAGLAPTGVEIGIAASVLLLGIMVAGRVRLANPVAMALIGFFALFHGAAHGAEMTRDTNILAYMLGFVCATGLLHLSGVLLGRRLLRVADAYRATGVFIGGFGLVLLLQAV